MPASDVSPHPPGASPAVRSAARHLVEPVGRFFRVEAASGLVLWLATFVALAWANWPGSRSYEALWELPFGLQLGADSFVHPLRFWVNDGLMTLFFFVVGLEIRWEIHQGELSSFRRAALPVAAAAGGMIVPALLYAAINRGSDTAAGWGVPIATDIAFAAGVLALAVIDDIGAIVVITLAYSQGVEIGGLLVFGLATVALLALRKLGVRHVAAYAVPAIAMWCGLHRAGLHPTLAGVALGLLTPVRAWYGRRGVVDTAREVAAAIERAEDLDLPVLLERLKRARREALPPVTKLRHDLHAWVAFGVMPLFALANAGVELSGLGGAAGRSTAAFCGIVVGLVVGKPAGILAATFLATRAKVAELPPAVGWRGVVVMGVVAGIGFTMSIFMAGLAFDDPDRLRAAKAAVLAASLLAALLGLLAGRALLPRRDDAAPDAATDPPP